jgi:hypothetical protein
MKWTIFLIAAVLCLVFADRAQAQRRLPSQQGIQLTAGMVNRLNPGSKTGSSGFHAGAAFSSYTKSSNHWLFGGEYLQKRYLYNDMLLPLVQFTGEGGYFLDFLSDGSKMVFFFLGVSAIAGYETINWNDKLLPDGATIQNKDVFLYGAALTLETEIFLTDWTELLLNVRERTLSGSSVGKFNTQIGLGIRFIIN